MTDIQLPPTFNLGAYLADRNVAEGRGDKPAILCGDEAVTYAQVLERSNRAGNALRGLGLQREQRVMLLLLDTPAFVYSFFGVLKVGAVPVPTNTLLKPADYEYLLNDSRAVIAILSKPVLPVIESISRERLRYLHHIVVAGPPAQARGGAGRRPTRAARDVPRERLRRTANRAIEAIGPLSFDELVSRASPELEIEPTSRDEPAFWQYSSGTTGFPKGAVHLHRDLYITCQLYAQHVLGITEKDRTFSVAKLFFSYGLGNALTFPFSVGATTILWPGQPTAANIYAQIERYRPTLFFSVPTNYGMLLAHHRDGGPDFDLSSIRLAISAGEALPKALYERFKDRFGIEILDGIGSTEVGHIFISNRAGQVRPGSSGQLVPGYAAKIVDEDSRPVAQGEIGNLMIRGDSTCAYYWNKHEQTRNTIEGHWIRTGDKYWQDADGYYWYAGRTDDMLKVGGMWVSPIEVENTLVEHTAVREAAVVGQQDSDGLDKPLAHVVLADGYRPSDGLAHELQEFVRSRIAEYKRPRWVKFVPELPKTATGKIQRYKLR